MNWNNLKQEKCPRCSSFLKKKTLFFCPFCNFKISFGKVVDLVGKANSLEKQANRLLKRSM